MKKYGKFNKERIENALKVILEVCDKNVQKINEEKKIFYLTKNNFSIEIIKLLAKPSDFKLTDKEGCSVLHIAASNNDLQTISYFFESKCNINSKSNEGMTPFLCFCKRKQFDENIFNFFLSSKSDINAKDNKNNNALHLLTNKKEIEKKFIDILVQKKLDLNAENSYRNTPLQISMNKSNSFEFVSYLVEKKASLQSGGGITGSFCFENLISNFTVSFEMIDLLQKYTSPQIFRNSVIKLLIEKYQKTLQIPQREILEYLVKKGKFKINQKKKK